ncbi:hypothetical protein [Phenylobacterium aquaticum]|uniref:hypothetical protein n=1 Tax=Phenylobacterium aquaticum TaxID=1763816 RepID=UPI001F5D65DC|nr:hypothetical protein [Phenylobacterium aquaticum]MCI3134049.1 hypothetical protein [Phenylobacterium aquaticum]
MTDPQRLALVRSLHTAIYAVMASATLMVFYAGVTGAHGPWLAPALVLTLMEAAVFAASGMKCPLTAMVARYDPTGGEVSDTWLPKRLTRHTLTVFGPLLAVGLVGLAARWMMGR